MRRTILYTAGLMVAAGASLALASPASAAPAPYTPTYPSSNFQYLGQNAWTNQTTLNDIANSQYGLGNVNGGGVVYTGSYTGQYGGILGGY